jgi:FG-GAP-like repeat
MVVVNTGRGTLSPLPEVRTGSDPLTVAIADVNGARRVDLVSANTGEGDNGHSLSITVGRGDGRFKAARHRDLGGSRRPWGLVPEDFDGDRDVALSGRSQFQLLSGNGRRAFVARHLLDASHGAIADLRGVRPQPRWRARPPRQCALLERVLISLGEAGGTFQPIQRIDVINTTSKRHHRGLSL